MSGGGACSRLGVLEFRSRNPRYQKLWYLLLPVGLAAGAAPIWKAPVQLKLGELQTLELREEDPSKPAPGRPALEDRLGPLHLRAVEPLADGRGWRLQVQALTPGLAVIPPLDLGDGQRSPELSLEVPRTIPFGGPWVGFGGGNDDLLPAIPFPWAWASLLLLPPLALGAWLFQHWRRGRGKRRFHHAAHAFQHHWPPRTGDRAALDGAHALGRDLLAARFGEAARAWGPAEFQSLNLGPWDQWVLSLDAARFGRTEPPFPAAASLLAALDGRSGLAVGNATRPIAKALR